MRVCGAADFSPGSYVGVYFLEDPMEYLDDAIAGRHLTRYEELAIEHFFTSNTVLPSILGGGEDPASKRHCAAQFKLPLLQCNVFFLRC
jgi:hypothetical protein